MTGIDQGGGGQSSALHGRERRSAANRGQRAHRSWLAAVALLALALLGLLLPAVGDASAGDEPDSATYPGDTVVAVVLLRPSLAPGATERQAEIRATQDDLVASLPDGRVGAVHRFENLPAVAIEITSRDLIDQLRADPRVARVDVDVAGRALLADVLPLVGADRMHASGFDGSGVTIAVIDTGVDSLHPDLASSILDHQLCFGYNGGPTGVGYCPDGTDQQIGSKNDTPAPAADTDGHGTHVAGIITSDGLVAPRGVAPGADILAIKALDNGAVFASFMFNVVAALDYLISHPELGVDVVNLSLGTFGEFVGDCDNATAFTMAGAAAVNSLLAQGVTVIASAGSSGSRTSMPAPACLSGVISVGASDDADAISAVSNANAATDLFAPGVGVVSDEPGGTTGTRTGSSMAAAVASGCAALLIDAGYGATPGRLLDRLTTSPARVADASSGLSFPRVDCFAAPVIAPIATPAPVPTSSPQLDGPTITNPPSSSLAGPFGFGAIQPEVPSTAPAPAPPPGALSSSAEDAPGRAQSIAFTGSNPLGATAIALALIGLGSQLLIIRRRLSTP